jgi:hypothetical protein
MHNPEFTTDLFQPTYPNARLREWEFKNIILAGERGYWGELHGMRPIPILTGPSIDGNSSWMSMAAVELQSQ